MPLLNEQNKPDKKPTFEARDQFLRRIPPWHLKGPSKVSSAAFQNDDNTDRMSVNWLKLSSVEHTLSGLLGYGVASISAELCYSLKQEPVYSPVVDNPAHSDIVGHKTLAISRRFRDGAQYLLYPRDQLPPK
jgi:hypothetical protein